MSPLRRGLPEDGGVTHPFGSRCELLTSNGTSCARIQVFRRGARLRHESQRNRGILDAGLRESRRHLAEMALGAATASGCGDADRRSRCDPRKLGWTVAEVSDAGNVAERANFYGKRGGDEVTAASTMA